MATSFSLTQTPLAPTLTAWDSSAITTWNDYSADSWETARDSVSYAAVIGETLTSGELCAINQSAPQYEMFGVSDFSGSDYLARHSEFITASELIGLLSAFNSAIAEGVSVAEAINKATSLSRSDVFAVGDELRRNSQAVISDILIGNTDITPSQFDLMLTQAQATGYDAFTTFIGGDYEYKNAIFKAVIQSTDISSGRVNALQIDVDVPDVFDSGTAAITIAGTTVSFAKFFNAPPEVNASIKGGAVFAIPRISVITPTTFFVELFDASNNRVAGTVSWAAHGY